MRNQLGLALVGIIVVVGMAAPARADVAIDLKAKDPAAALPAISGDHTQFLRQFRVWKPGCKKPEIQVEYGPIDPDAIEPAYTSMPLVGGCGEAADAYQQNIAAVNESLRDTQCASATVRDKVQNKIPTTFEADDLHVEITTTANTINIQINPLARTAGAYTGGRRFELPGATALHGWYLVEQGEARQIALLFAAPDADGGVTERWVEVWLRPVAAKPTPEDIARTWLLALARGDAAVLAEVTGKTFERAGLEAGKCKARVAKKAAQVAGVLACALAVSPRYVELYDEVEFEVIKIGAVPKLLKKSKSKIKKLAKKATIVQFHVEQDGWDATIVFTIKAGKVTGAFEAVRPI